MKLIEQILRKIFCIHEWKEIDRVALKNEWGMYSHGILEECKQCYKLRRFVKPLKSNRPKP